jgi:hypothetical protein
MIHKQVSKKSLNSASKGKAKTAKKGVEKGKRPPLHRNKRTEIAIRVPRTCLESPALSSSRKISARTSSCEPRLRVPGSHFLKPSKKGALKSKTKAFLSKHNSKPLEENVISPIKKIQFDFCNCEDISMIKVLEIL